MGELIPAATIILLRDDPAFEVLMVERHADIAFAGGALVFPGGRIDAGDHLSDWRDYCDGLEEFPPEQHAPRVAALREAFEETGILIARRDGELLSADEARALAPWRQQIENDDALFLAMVRQENLRLDMRGLQPFTRWRPPKGVGHRRYDTWFFAARAPAEQIASPDGGEATEIVWTPPADALKARDRGERKMIFPTSRNVELLNVSKTADDVLERSLKRRPHIVEPAIVERDGQMYLTIPDDLGYPITEEALTSAMRS